MRIVDSFRYGVARTIVTLFLLCGVVPLSLSGMVFLFSYYKSEKRAIGNVQEEVAQRIATSVSAHIERATGEVQLFSRVIDLHNPDPRRLSSLALGFLDLDTAFNIITIMDRKGTEVCKFSRHYTFRPFEMGVRGNDPSFLAALSGSIHFGSISISRFSQFTELPVTVPIHDTSGSFAGAIEVGVDVSKLWELISKYRIGKDRYAYIVDSRGLLIAYEDVAPVIRSTDLSTIPGVQRLLTSRTAAHEYTGLRKELVLGAGAPVPLTGWGVVVEEPLARAYSGLYALSAIFLLVFAGSVSVIVVLGLRFSFSKIVHPIQRLKDETGLIAKGQFDQRVEVTDRLDEIGQLAEAFNAMASDLQTSTVSRDLLLKEIAERKKAEEALRLEEARLEALLQINQMVDADLDEISRATMEEAVRLTQSSIGYVAFLDADQTSLTMQAWSMGATQECRVHHVPVVYPVDKAGLWGEAVRQRRPIITNDYEAPNPLKRGLPEGHVLLKRHLNVPIFDGDRIVIVAGVGNKPSDYDQSDVRQLNLLMLGLWRIVQRRTDENALRESENKLRSIVEHSNNLFYSHTPEHVLTYVSPQTRQFFDCEPEEALVRWMEFASDHPINRGALSLVESAIRSGERCPPYRMELVGKRGRRIWVEVNESPVLENGKTVSIVGALTDITDRIEAEQALRENEEKYRSVVDQTRDWIFLVDSETWRILEANQTMLAMLDYTPTELLGSRFHDLADIEGTRSSQLLHDAARENCHYLGELSFRARGGKTVQVEVSANMIAFAGKRVLCVVARDLTDRKKMEQEFLRAQKIESVGVLAGGIAHDFNNILTAVIGNLSLARASFKPDNDVSHFLSEMEKACFRAKDLTRQLLTFAKGGAPIKRAASIAHLVKESVTFALRGSNVRPDLHVADNLWIADVDEGQISQVLNNLVINAKQAMPDGGSIAIHAENAVLLDSDRRLPLASGPYVVITVQDQGCGIPPQHLASIFDPYFTTKETGSGLGLAVAYSIMKSHGGTITVESEPGNGSSFRLYLPAREAGRAEEQPACSGSSATPSGMRVLVMDDEEMVRNVVGSMLQHLGCEVVFARDGTEVLNVYAENVREKRPFDVVILDLTVPGGMGGKEAVQKLRQIDPCVRAIVSSGYSNNPIMASYEEHGFVGIVTKPFNLIQLQEVLHAGCHAPPADLC
ncbi:MAG: PAS domain S-box protein [Syntrophobacteraceae bacterium]